MSFLELLRKPLISLFDIPEEVPYPRRYAIIRRNILILMLVITLTPLVVMAVINYYQYEAALSDEILTPLRVLVNKTKHSFELLFSNQVATIRLISSAYSFNELADEKNLARIFRALRQEFKGFIDLGLINSNGIQVSYVGPYDLKGKDYSDQAWFQQVRLQGLYISDVFMGHRKFPHVVIAAQHMTDSGDYWFIRATIDTRRFDELIASMGLDPQSDAFLLNTSGALQTSSKLYGQVLDQLKWSVPPTSFEPSVIEQLDSRGREVFISYAYLNVPDYILMLVKPKTAVLKSWYSLKSDLLVVFVLSVIIIMAVVYKITYILVDRLRVADERRQLALQEIEHTQKLSSIGRLAAGVAHEINNPMAIINEKAGLMKDIIELTKDFPKREKFLQLVAAITQSVDRCRTITHRLLGFARRMEVEIQPLDVNDVLKETLGFLEKEALHRNVEIKLNLADDLPRIASDRGQLQQVFLNLLNNALAAIQEGGFISVSSWEKDLDTIGISIQDNGIGMSEETLKHIFEPFFTTKKGSGTGLGLAITYGIIKKLGGEIEVKSKTGQGSQFIIFLPKKPQENVGA